MRCPDCGKFVSFDTDAEPEVSDPELHDNGTVTSDARRVLPCGECGTELKEHTFDIEVDLEDGPGCEKNDGKAHEWDDDTLKLDISATTEYEGKGRGTKTFYGIEGSVEVTCKKCDQTRTVEISQRESASGFEEMV